MTTQARIKRGTLTTSTSPSRTLIVQSGRRREFGNFIGRLKMVRRRRRRVLVVLVLVLAPVRRLRVLREFFLLPGVRLRLRWGTLTLLRLLRLLPLLLLVLQI